MSFAQRYYHSDGSATDDLVELLVFARAAVMPAGGWQDWVLSLSYAAILPESVSSRAEHRAGNAAVPNSTKFIDPRIDMMVFDHLPRCVRDALNDVPLCLDASTVIQVATREGWEPEQAASALYRVCDNMIRAGAQ